MKFTLVFIFVLSLGFHARAQYYDSAQIANIHANKTASEGDLYQDTIKKEFYIGLTSGALTKINNAAIKKLSFTNDSLYIEGDDSTHSVRLFRSTPYDLALSGTVATWHSDSSCNANITLTQASTSLSILNFKPGNYGTLKVIQDATGGRELTLPANSKVINGGNGIIPLTSTPNAVDIISFYFDGVDFYWTYGNNYD